MIPQTFDLLVDSPDETAEQDSQLTMLQASKIRAKEPKPRPGKIRSSTCLREPVRPTGVPAS